MYYTSHLGKAAEDYVAQHLIKNGFRILERNYRKRDGEIDLIASKTALVVFVEVKMRQENYFDLSDVITPSKQRKIISVAKKYMAKIENNQCSYRFDVALLQGKQTVELTYIANAFNEGGCTW